MWYDPYSDPAGIVGVFIIDRIIQQFVITRSVKARVYCISLILRSKPRQRAREELSRKAIKPR